MCVMRRDLLRVVTRIEKKYHIEGIRGLLAWPASQICRLFRVLSMKSRVGWRNMGNNCHIGRDVVIRGCTKVVLGDGVTVGDHVVFWGGGPLCSAIECRLATS